MFFKQHIHLLYTNIHKVKDKWHTSDTATEQLHSLIHMYNTCLCVHTMHTLPYAHKFSQDFIFANFANQWAFANKTQKFVHIWYKFAAFHMYNTCPCVHTMHTLIYVHTHVESCIHTSTYSMYVYTQMCTSHTELCIFVYGTHIFQEKNTCFIQTGI